jgi:FtsZ-binding cell division protein ZapB
MSLIGGLIALVLGIVSLIFWFGYFIKGLMAVLPVLFVLGGALAVYLGIEEIKDKSASDSFDDETSELKNEVESLKEEIKGLKEEKQSSDEKNRDKTGKFS